MCILLLLLLAEVAENDSPRKQAVLHNYQERLLLALPSFIGRAAQWERFSDHCTHHDASVCVVYIRTP